MNTAATSNQEIVEMLSRSSSAMAEANNSLEQTIALETAAKLSLAGYIEICIENIFNCKDCLKLYATI